MKLFDETISWIQSNPLMIGLIWMMLFDIILGTGRAIIEKTFNSSVGKKGLILKVAMLLAAVCAVFMDYAVNINFLSIIPSNITDALGVGQPGLCETVIILFWICELISIVKNWSKLGLPGAKKLEELLKKYTSEL